MNGQLPLAHLKMLSSVWIWIRDFFTEGDDLLLVKVGGRRIVKAYIQERLLIGSFLEKQYNMKWDLFGFQDTGLYNTKMDSNST